MWQIPFLLIPILFLSSCSHRFSERIYPWDDYKSGSIDSEIESRFPAGIGRERIKVGDMELLEVSYHEIESWNSDDQRNSLKAFVRGCEKERDVNIESTCDIGTELYKNGASSYEIKSFFENRFTPYFVIDRERDRYRGTITGYYVPLLHGSRKRTKKYRYPIYAKPRDFRLPYLTHKEIDSKIIDAPVICWVDDRVDRLVLHIQGSGMVKLTDGSIIGVGYAEKNGYSFRSSSSYINKTYGIPLYKLSFEFIKNWIKKYPHRADEVLHHNESYIFFREQGRGEAIGAMGTNLVPKSTIAIDRKHIPLGMPIFIQSENRKDPHLNHLFMAQDTGGAIKGVVRADLFFGFGEKAGKEAKTTKREGEFFMLIPNGYQF
jgi:membrane-bound lytic murein transglycosylase A